MGKYNFITPWHTKICPGCNQERDLDTEYGRDRERNHGRSLRCKYCFRNARRIKRGLAPLPVPPATSIYAIAYLDKRVSPPEWHITRVFSGGLMEVRTTLNDLHPNGSREYKAFRLEPVMAFEGRPFHSPYHEPARPGVGTPVRVNRHKPGRPPNTTSRKVP